MEYVGILSWTHTQGTTRGSADRLYIQNSYYYLLVGIRTLHLNHLPVFDLNPKHLDALVLVASQPIARVRFFLRQNLNTMLVSNLTSETPPPYLPN